MTHSNTNPRFGQYLTHANRHITRVVACLYCRGGCTAPLYKRQLRTTHVGAGGWKPHGSSPTACTEKMDQTSLPIGVNKFMQKKKNNKRK